MFKRRLYLTLITLIAFLSTEATPYCDIRKFSITDGLAANTIADLQQGYDNLMWFATWNGLSYYDGYTFHTFRDEPGRTDILTTNRIKYVRPCQDYDVWCVTDDRELYVYNTHTCEFEQTGKQLNEQFGINLKVDNIYHLPTGFTWITSMDGKYIIRMKRNPYEANTPSLIRVGEQGLKSGKIWFVRSDFQKREWVLTDKGTFIWGGHFSSNLPFKWIREVGKSVFFATVDGKVGVVDDQNHLSMIPMPAGVTKINQLKNTGYQLLIATNLGMVIYDQKTFKSQIVNVQSPSQPMSEVTNMYVDMYNMVWVFTDGMGVTLVNPKDGTKQWLFADADDPSMRTSSDRPFIIQDEHNTLWVVPNKGTFSYYDRRAKKLVPYILKSNSSGNYRIPDITKFAISDQGILWLAGVHDLTQINFKDHPYIINNLDQGESEVKAIANTPAGIQWVGYLNGCIQLNDHLYKKIGYLSPSGQIVPQQIPFTSTGIYSLFQDSKQRMWIGTRHDGLYLYDNGHITHFTNDPANKYSLPKGKIFDIVSDRMGRTWLGMYDGGGLVLVQENNGNISFVSSNNGLSWPKDINSVRHITCTPTGEILVSSRKGMVTFRDDFQNYSKIKFYKSEPVKEDTTSITAYDVNYIFAHSNGRIYTSVIGGYMQKLQDKTSLKDSLKFTYFRNINPSEGLVQSMLEDGSGNMWIVREASLDRVNMRTGNVEVFGPNDFDYNMTFTDARPCYNPTTGNITVGTPMGSVTFNPKRLTKTSYQPKIIFTNLHFIGETQNTPILHREKLVIPANKRNLTISFAALDYTRKYQMQYLYRIEGLMPEGEWINLGSSNTIGFNRISHGDYILKVKATNTHGIWSKYVAELPIEVRPTFWESFWGKVLIFVLFMIALTVALYTYNQRQRQNLDHEMSQMKNQFFSDASHKLRTPLTLIGGPVVEVLKNEENMSEESRSMLNMVVKNSRQMLDMLNQILKFDNSHNFYANDGLADDQDYATDQESITDDNAHDYLTEDEAQDMAEQFKRGDKDYTILVVEDNDDLRQFLYTILKVDYNVLLAENGRVGLIQARKHVPDFILTDVTMPVMDGITMVHQIKQDSNIAHIPIIILSAKASLEDHMKGFEEGIDGYMTKPFSATYLKGRIEALISQRHALQQEMLKKIQASEQANFKQLYAGEGSINSSLSMDMPPAAKAPGKQEEGASVPESLPLHIDDPVVEKTMRYIMDNISDPDMKIDTIAQAMGMSRSVLYSKIKSAVGMTPVDFVRHLRIMRATELLQQTNDNLTSIAYAVGFSDSKYFSKVFKKEMGIIPREYRERTK